MYWWLWCASTREWLMSPALRTGVTCMVPTEALTPRSVDKLINYAEETIVLTFLKIRQNAFQYLSRHMIDLVAHSYVSQKKC